MIDLTQQSSKSILSPTCANFRYVYLSNGKLAHIPVDIEISGVGERPVRGEVQSRIRERGEITCKTLAMSQMNPVHCGTCYSVPNCNATENAIEGIRSTIEHYVEKQVEYYLECC